MAHWFSICLGRTARQLGRAAAGGTSYWAARADAEPGNPLVRARAGDDLARRGDREGAIAHWLEAADLYLGLELPVRALATLGPLLRLDPQNSEAQARIATIAQGETPPSKRSPEPTDAGSQGRP